MSKDYYQTLGVERGASGDEIKRAYRKVAMRWHPDRNAGDKEAEVKFKEASEAYAVLSNASKRTQYDRFGRVEGMQDFDFESVFSGMGGGFGDVFGDIFSEFFGGGRTGGRRVRRGRDLEYDLELDFKEAAFGAAPHILIPRRDECSTCGGLGARSARDIQVCGTCQGSGQQRVQQGFFAVATTCNRCGGKGKIIHTACSKCKGQGIFQQNHRLQVNIPSGVQDGAQLRLSGEGEAGENQAPHGDLYLRIHIRPHAIFERNDNNLLCEMPLDFITATLGGEVTVPTLDGKVSLSIPSGTESGKVFRIRGHGIPKLGTKSRGDLYVHVSISVPSRMSKKQRALLEEFKQLQHQEHTAQYPSQEAFERKAQHA